MIQFDEVLSETVRVVESMPWAPDLQSVTIIRDLQGRVRLAFRFQNGKTWPPNGREALGQQLSAALGSYWGNQIWPVSNRRDRAHESL
jgi:hypothetical protein